MPSMDDEKWKDDMLAALKTIKGKMGYVRTLAKDELEKAKFDIGLNKKISKRMAKRETKRQQKKMTEKDRSIQALKSSSINNSMYLLTTGSRSTLMECVLRY